MTDSKTLLNELRGKGIKFNLEGDGRVTYSVDGSLVREVIPVIETNYQALSEMIKREGGYHQKQPVAPPPSKPQLSPRDMAASGLSPATIEALQRGSNQAPTVSPSHEPEDLEIPYYVYMG